MLRLVSTTAQPAFRRYIGIHYSGAETPDAGLKGLRVFVAPADGPAAELPPPPGPKRYWSRRGLAEWLAEALAEELPTIVGIDHGFSFPLRWFEVYRLAPAWDAFLDDFREHWPTDAEHTYVDFIRDALHGRAHDRVGLARWHRLTEQRLGAARSMFRFEGQGAIGKTTHAGLPWLRWLRRRLGEDVHFWPFDGWDIPAQRSALVEVCPSLWKRAYPTEGRSADQHDAWSVATWLQQADHDGRLAQALRPALTGNERTVAQVEGWILGVA
jgi:hypothetical protein